MFKQKQRAKQIIVEIIRQAGGEFHNKTNMFKAFWKSHLDYTESGLGYLSGWPIVRMPNGPGIDNFNLLLGELMAEGVIDFEEVQKGEYTGFVFQLRNPSAYPMEEEAVPAIKSGTKWAKRRSSKQASQDSHGRGWEEAKNGSELNIYSDLLTDEEVKANSKELRKAAAAARKMLA